LHFQNVFFQQCFANKHKCILNKMQIIDIAFSKYIELIKIKLQK